METLFQDVRYALRMLRKSPGFTTVVVLTLAAGIGANTAMFSVVYAVLLRPLPFPHPEELVSVKVDMPGVQLSDVGLAKPEFDDLTSDVSVFQQISGNDPGDLNITGGEKAERVSGNAVSTNYFALLGAKPALGRVFDSTDFSLGVSEDVVVSDSFWRNSLGSDPHVLGRTIHMDTDPYRIIGVMPPEFRHPGPPLPHGIDVWIAWGFVAPPSPPPSRSLRTVGEAIARLRPGLTISAAQAKLDAYAASLTEQYPDDYPANARWRIRLVPLQKEVVGDTHLMLLLLFASVGAVLLIACLNIGSLLLARFAARIREVAIRQALGAGPWRLIRQCLTESLLLSLGGGVLAIPLSYFLKNALLTSIPFNLPRVSEIDLNGRVFLFAMAVSVIAGMLFGLAPTLQIADRRLVDKLSEGSKGTGVGGSSRRFLRTLVASEVALSLLLLVSAGLLLRSFWKVLEVQPGFDVDHLVSAQLSLPIPNDEKNELYPSHEKFDGFVREVTDRIRALPEVRAAAIGGDNSEFGGSHSALRFQIEGNAAPKRESPIAEVVSVSPRFFQVLGTPLIRGRFFAESDNENGEPVALIDQTAAHLFWPGQDPVGMRVQMGHLRLYLLQDHPEQLWRRIVGIVGNRNDGLDAPLTPHIFVPILQLPLHSLMIYTRTATNAGNVEEPIRRALRNVNPDVPVSNVRSMARVISDSLSRRRFAVQILGLFAVTAVLVAAIGIYGIMAYLVNERVAEIGVRMALGAQSGDVLKLIVRQGMLLTLTGVAVGLVASFALTRLISSMLFGVVANDPITLVVSVLLLTSISLLANYFPASKAAKIDPLIALRRT